MQDAYCRHCDRSADVDYREPVWGAGGSEEALRCPDGRLPGRRKEGIWHRPTLDPNDPRKADKAATKGPRGAATPRSMPTET